MTANRQLESRSTPRARQLRRDQTDAERAIWRRLRGRQLGGAKFRRQHPVGPYIVDFFCEEHRLVVEIDGGQHGPETDRQRTAYLETQGLTVLRFWNDDVLRSPDGVVQTLLTWVEVQGP